MGLEYIRMAPGFVKEAVEVYENWKCKEPIPMKIQELMMVLRIEVNRLYDPGAWERVAAMPKAPKLRDTRLSEQ